MGKCLVSRFDTFTFTLVSRFDTFTFDTFTLMQTCGMSYKLLPAQVRWHPPPFSKDAFQVKANIFYVVIPSLSRSLPKIPSNKHSSKPSSEEIRWRRKC